MRVRNASIYSLSGLHAQLSSMLEEEHPVMTDEESDDHLAELFAQRPYGSWIGGYHAA